MSRLFGPSDNSRRGRGPGLRPMRRGSEPRPRRGKVSAGTAWLASPVLAASLIFSTAVLAANSPLLTPTGALKAVAELHDAEGRPVGKVRFYALEDKTVVEARLHGFEPGYHGFHIHENAVCDADAESGPFTAAGGHYDPHGAHHAAHKGDMPPLFANRDGTAAALFHTDRFTPESLLEDEVAVIVHAGSDNLGNIPERYQSNRQDQPGPDQETLSTGDAGPRHACGVIEAAKKRS